ncbi:uncharacterized protein PHACADRAFT_210407 [Phanerochaete carnosa HHB-10118-sp]|uniref:Cytochrome P450 n=1 Tax=Phanerochaete carnosa (strain HHB-10118-sp) TaxID=650164 RepID=K5WVW6_PHACS|nr:uncharacterized protein PHACADRAFT_210407 [Phanerochaete carnosa HHB-10118-sp]EKM54607.1 hypothetical protein PHACADRAFT_210407 [Phanerochaete carnosa HHB-10118-sp]
MQLAEKYGDVMYFDVFGKSLVVLSSQEAASDLLEKRSAVYSSRSSSTVHEMIGWADMLTLLPYGEQFQKQRKFLQQAFTKQGCLAFRPSQLSQTHLLLKRIPQDPACYEDHVRRFTAAVIMEIAYGHKVASDDDPYVDIAERTHKILMEAGHSLSILDFFPWLRYLPSWFPGNWFGRFANDAASFVQHMRDMPFEQATGNAAPSFTSMQIEELERDGGASPESLQTLKIASSQMYVAGADSIWSTILNVIAVLFLHPKVQRKVHYELDRVLGGKRLPDFDDHESLPYLDAVIQETMRWHPTAPLGMPHRSTADDIYRGMYIPKGTTVLANSVAMSMDNTVYGSPTEFRPERFLPPRSEPLPVNISFGWGRRRALSHDDVSGRHLADASVWIVVASLLTVFEIIPAKDDKGQDIIPEIKWLCGITRPPSRAVSVAQMQKCARNKYLPCEHLEELNGAGILPAVKGE